ncbi:MAG: hypothetical protein MUO54_01360 [Anaerolineales bacterium]|nr:hypothetical protein [Anaerolineales bacterium]
MEKKFTLRSGQADLYQPDPKSVGNCFSLVVNLQEGSKLLQIALVGADQNSIMEKNI